VITVTSILWVWKTDAAGRWYFLTIPEEQSGEFRAESLARRGGFGSVRVQATIVPSTSSGQTTTWRTSVFPQKSGGYILPVKAEVRRDAGIAAGDEVLVELELVVGVG